MIIGQHLSGGAQADRDDHLPTNLKIQNTFRETAKNIGDAARRHDAGDEDPFSIRATDISPINKETYHVKANGSILHTNNDYIVT